MSEMADRLHEGLLDAFELVVPLLPNAWMDRRDGYVVVSAPSFPIHLANAAWAQGPDETSAIGGLGAALEQIEARGADPGVLVIEGRMPGVEAEARRLVSTGSRRSPGWSRAPRRSGHRPAPAPR